MGELTLTEATLDDLWNPPPIALLREPENLHAWRGALLALLWIAERGDPLPPALRSTDLRDRRALRLRVEERLREANRLIKARNRAMHEENMRLAARRAGRYREALQKIAHICSPEAAGPHGYAAEQALDAYFVAEGALRE